MSTPSAPLAHPTVALFVTCMVDTMYPRVGIAAVEVLERHGVDVVFPEEQTCCGQPAFNDGYRDAARQLARRFIDVFWPLLDSGAIQAIVAPSGSCVAMVRRFARLLEDEPGGPEFAHRAASVSRHTHELTQFLVDVLGVTDPNVSCTGRLTYHPCCHLLRELGVDAQPRGLLARVRNADVVDLPSADDCCGFGGLFALNNAAISTAMGHRKLRNIEASGAHITAVSDVSCMTHLNGLLAREGRRCRAVHVAEILNGSTGADVTDAVAEDDR